MKKKLLSLVCALALTISLLPAAQALEGEGTRAAEALASLGLVTGTGAGYAAEDAATQEQAAALLIRFARMQGAAIPADAAPVYVPECSAWAQTDVQAAYAAGILDRYAACLAAPQQAASRAELARMLRLLSTLLQKA